MSKPLGLPSGSEQGKMSGAIEDEHLIGRVGGQGHLPGDDRAHSTLLPREDDDLRRARHLS